MKNYLLLFITIIVFVLTIISKEINLFLSFILLFFPILINYYFSKKEGIEIRINSKIILLFYLFTCVLYYLISKDHLSCIILYLLQISYLFYNPRLKIEEDILYTKEIFIKKNVVIPENLKKDFLKAGITIKNNTQSNKNINTIKSIKELESLYRQIKINRNRYENLIRSKKYKIVSSFIIPFIIIFIYIFNLPNPITILVVLFTYFLYTITNVFLSIFLPSEKDIMKRKPRIKGENLYSKEEKLFIIVNIICNIIAITIPYMSIIYNTNNPIIASYTLMITIIIANIVNIAYHIDDNLTIINLLTSFNSIIYITIIITSIAITVNINKIYYIYHIYPIVNYLKIVIISLFAIAWEDIIKIARYLHSKKGE